jgi:hypothetical protein
MRTHMTVVLSVSLLAASHAGCWLEPDAGMNEPDAGMNEPDAGMNEPDAGIDGSLPECPDSVPIVIQHDQVCPPEGCVTNTPHVHGLAFDGLYLDGTPSDQGFRILGFRKDGRNGVISVGNGMFQATLTDGTVPVKANVEGGFIELEWHDPAAGCIKRYDLEIKEMHRWQPWTAQQDEVVPVYTVYALDRKTESSVPICSKYDNEDTHAVLLVNERYDVDGAKVLDTEPDWFTIACEGSALFKMRFAGYDPDPMAAVPTTLLERQATLKMITADYCGTGDTYTEVGTPLRWQNRHEWCSNVGICPFFPEPSNIMSHEAIWGPDGALCLDNPRLGNPEDIHCPPDSPIWPDKVIPGCKSTDTMASLGGEWETFNPYPSLTAP